MAAKTSTTHQKGKQSKRGSSSKPSSSQNTGANKFGPTWVPLKAITHPEHHHTLNHLNQVAAYYAMLSASLSSPPLSDTACRLQGEMVRSAKALSRKAVIRMDTAVKRGTCLKCDAVWVEGMTVQVRSRGSGPHRHVVKWRCAVCGVVVRRPAPDLVPQFKVPQLKEVEQMSEHIEQVVQAEGTVRESDQDQVEMTPVKKKVSQRERRRIASIKRRLLHRSDPIITENKLKADLVATTGFSAPPASSKPPSTDSAHAPKKLSKPKLSRSQMRKQRLEKLALRASKASTSNTALPARGRRKIPGLRPEERASLIWVTLEDTPTSSQSSQASTEAPVQASVDVPVEAPLQSQSEHVSTRPKSRAPCPQLPHFNDRIQGSHWDDTFPTLDSLLHQSRSSFPPNAEPSAEQDKARYYSTHALLYWKTAARSRGDHLLITGVGKNGALGPVLP